MKQRKKSFGMRISAFVLSFAMVCTLLAGVNVVAFAAETDDELTDTVSVLRAYNPNNGEHLMTIDETEYNANVARGYDGEGEAWVAPLYSETEVWRAYNPNSGEHMLAPEAEVKALEAAGWQNEGLKMYSDDDMGTPIYRVFNPNATDAGSHHYCGEEEAAALVELGWQWDNNAEPVIYGVAEEPPVILVGLTDADQLSANTLTVTFDQAASALVDKDDLTVAKSDGTQVLPINNMEFSLDGTEATLTLAAGFEDGKEYTVSLNGTEVTFTASVGDVATVVVKTASAQQGVETPIEFALFDEMGVDVTSNVKVNDTCSIDIQGAQGETTPSAPTIIMDTVGETATVTITYNSQEEGAEDVVGVGVVTCIEAEAVVGVGLHADIDDNADTLINDESESAKFYWGESVYSTSPVSVEVDEDNRGVFFCAVDLAAMEAIGYDTYEITSSDEDIMTVQEDVTTGKFAEFTVHGNAIGSANVVVKATKYEKDTVYTVPVTVTKKGTLSSIKYTFSKTSMSNAIDAEYAGKVKVKGYDTNGKEIPYGEDGFSISYEVSDYDTKAGNAKDVQQNVTDNLIGAAYSGFGFDQTDMSNPAATNFGKITDSQAGPEAAYHAWNSESVTETIHITASQNDKVIERKPTVTVSAIDAAYWDNTTGSKDLSITYKVDLEDSSIDIIGGAMNDKAYVNTIARLAAYNGSKFIGYVRSGDANGSWGVIGTARLASLGGAPALGQSASTGSAVRVTADSVLTDVKQGVKFGAKYSTMSNETIPIATAPFTSTVNSVKLYDSANNMNATSITDPLAMTTHMPIFAFAPVNGLYSDASYMVVGDTSKDKFYAKPGNYTVRYEYQKNGKKDGVQTTLKVTNPLLSTEGMAPNVTVLSRNVTGLDESSIKEKLKTQVDMNNNTSSHESIDGLYGAWAQNAATPSALDTSGDSVTVKYAAVHDNYAGHKITFFVPVGKTFYVSE